MDELEIKDKEGKTVFKIKEEKLFKIQDGKEVEVNEVKTETKEKEPEKKD